MPLRPPHKPATRTGQRKQRRIYRFTCDRCGRDFSGVTPGCEVVLGALQKLRTLDGLERAELTFQIGHMCALRKSGDGRHHCGQASAGAWGISPNDRRRFTVLKFSSCALKKDAVTSLSTKVDRDVSWLRADGFRTYG